MPSEKDSVSLRTSDPSKVLEAEKLFSMLSGDKQTQVIDLLKSLLSEQ